MTGPHDEFVAWSIGRLDAMGSPFSEWPVARYNADGSFMRDADGRQVFETQAEYIARQAAPINPPAEPAQAGAFRVTELKQAAERALMELADEAADNGNDIEWLNARISNVRAALAAIPAPVAASVPESLRHALQKIISIKKVGLNAPLHAEIDEAQEIARIALPAAPGASPAEPAKSLFPEWDKLRAATASAPELDPEYTKAVAELANAQGMTPAQVLRAAIRLYQAEQRGSVAVTHPQPSDLLAGEDAAEPAP